MTEADEVAANLPPLPKGATMHEARKRVRCYMPDETDVVIDNVAEALLRQPPSRPDLVLTLEAQEVDDVLRALSDSFGWYEQHGRGEGAARVKRLHDKVFAAAFEGDKL